jgi:drug/metabolite transporter (DMT)-like permease
MAIAFAALAAACSGTGDFLGGLASRRGRVMAVVVGSHAAGIIASLALAPLVGGSPTAADLWWGAAAGIAGGLGILGLYQGFSRSDIGVVSPIAAVGAAGWPVLFAIVLGERPSGVVWVGLALGVVGIWMVSRGEVTGAPVAPGVTMGLAAGIGFGGLLVLLSRVGDDAGIWPLAPARLAGLVVLVLVALYAGNELVPLARSRFPMVGAGVATIVGNGSFILATREGSLAVVSVVAAMFPVATVVLARVVWQERFSRPRLAGLALALVAVALVAVG